MQIYVLSFYNFSFCIPKANGFLIFELYVDIHMKDLLCPKCNIMYKI